MSTPTDTVNQLMEALQRGDLDAALALYEIDGVLIAQPGQEARGSAQLAAALKQFIALKPRMISEALAVVERGDIALSIGRWSLQGTDPAGQPVSMRGESSDVLRRHDDGRWLIAIDN